MASSLQDHFLVQREIQQLENDDDQRKNLVKLSILKMFHLSKSINKDPSHTVDNTTSASTSRIEELTKKNHDYELTINKLKQLHTTKEKLQESKLESLREEVWKLKQQLKDQPRNNLQVPTLSHFQPNLEAGSSRPSSAFSTSPYVNKIMFNQGNGGLAKNYLSPTFNSINKSVFVPDFKSSILSPIQHKRKVLMPTKAKREYTNYNSMKKQFEQNGQLPQKENTVEPETPNKRVTRAVSKKVSSPAPVPTSTRHSSNSTNRSSASPSLETADLTPTRLPNNGKLFDDKMRSLDEVINKSFTSANTSEAENDTPDANSTTIDSTTSRTTAGRGAHMSEDETFASANSSLAKSSEKKDKKKKKLRLWKSEVSKVSISSPNDKTLKNRNKGLHLEDEGLNTLNYYQDENFLNDNNDTPKVSRKRKNDETETTPLAFKKKKKNVFKID